VTSDAILARSRAEPSRAAPASGRWTYRSESISVKPSRRPRRKCVNDCVCTPASSPGCGDRKTSRADSPRRDATVQISRFLRMATDRRRANARHRRRASRPRAESVVVVGNGRLFNLSLSASVSASATTTIERSARASRSATTRRSSWRHYRMPHAGHTSLLMRGD
jgi:hypothetical protein